MITGPTSGFGLHVARELAGEGTAVLVGRTPEKLERVKTGVEALAGGRAVTVTVDFSDLSSFDLYAARCGHREMSRAGSALHRVEFSSDESAAARTPRLRMS